MTPKPKWGDQIGKYFIDNQSMEMYRVIDSCWKSYIILVNMSKSNYSNRFSKTTPFKSARFTEIQIEVIKKVN